MEPGFYVFVNAGNASVAPYDEEATRRMVWADGPFVTLKQAHAYAEKWVLSRASSDPAQVVGINSYGYVVLTYGVQHKQEAG